MPIPEIGVNGAAWGSVACHLVAFTIAISSLRKNIKLDLTVSKFIIKPIIAVAIMGICSYFSYVTLLRNNCRKIGNNNSNRHSCNHLCSSNCSFKSIFERRNKNGTSRRKNL